MQPNTIVAGVPVDAAQCDQMVQVRHRLGDRQTGL
jgi:hypothetical protein